jgi:hypothetical protein
MDFESKGRGFKSLRACQFFSIELPLINISHGFSHVISVVSFQRSSDTRLDFLSNDSGTPRPLERRQPRPPRSGGCEGEDDPAEAIEAFPTITD